MDSVLSFWREIFYYSTSVSLLLLRSFFLSSFFFWEGVLGVPLPQGGKYVSTLFLATNKEWFFSGFSYMAWYIIVIFHTLVL